MSGFVKGCKLLVRHVLSFWRKPVYPHIAESARVDSTVRVTCPENLYMEEHTTLSPNSTILNSRAKLIMKKYSGAAFGVSIITGNHMNVPGYHHKMITAQLKEELDPDHEYDKDVIVGEDVWLAANVTILSGVTVGRGAIVGAGSVVRYDVPPYAIVAGNPAKVVGFRFTPNIILLHEEELYPEEERLPEELLQENYKKYFVSKIKDIQNYLSL